MDDYYYDNPDTIEKSVDKAIENQLDLERQDQERKKEIEIEKDAEKKEPEVEEDPIKKELNKLKTKQYEHADKSRPYVDADIPDSVKFGEKLVIKLSRKVPNMQLSFGDGLSWERKDVYDPKAPKELILRPTVFRDIKNGKFDDDKVEIDIGEIKKVAGTEIQSWLEGDYLLKVRGYGNQHHEDTTITKTVRVHG
jgi:hypothetical protein